MSPFILVLNKIICVQTGFEGTYLNMATTDNVMFEQLLEQMKELNRNLETTSFAFNSLTMQLSSKDLGATAMNSIPQSNTKQANSDASANGKQTPSLTNNSDNGASNQAPRAIGYINWNSSHDILKTQRLIKMTSIRAALEKLQSDDTKNIAGKTDNDDYDEYDDDHYEGDPIMSKINGENHSGHFTFNIQVPHVDKEWRFPQVSSFMLVVL